MCMRGLGIDEEVERSGGINTALLDKRLGDMEKRLTKKMDTLNHLQSVESLKSVPFCPNLVDASEEPVVATCNQFFIVAGFGVCQSHFVYQGRLIISMDGACGFKV